MKNSLWLVLLIVLLGLSDFSFSQTTKTYDLLQAEGYVAFVVNAVPPKVPVPEPAVNCTCKGTKQIRTGDNRILPCPCENCTCSKPNGDAPITQLHKQIIYIGASWCAPCTIFKNTQFPKLPSLGFDIGPEDWRTFRVLDADTEEGLKYSKGRPIPCIILLEEGVEVAKIDNSKYPATAESVQSLWMLK